MLAKRIIPCLDVDKGRVVKGVNFVDIKEAGDPVELAKYYNKAGADELVFLDITASIENRQILLDIVKRTARKVTIPFSVGGGIRTVEDMRLVLKSGADKVSINTGGVKDPKLFSKCANEFGSQCVVLSLDAKKIRESRWNVFINGGRTDTGISAVEWAKKAVCLGAGEILLTSIDTDGMTGGFNTELTKIVSEAVSVPIIASGGAGELADFKKILTDGGADAALAASVFHFGKYTIKEVKNYLEKNNIPIRV